VREIKTVADESGQVAVHFRARDGAHAPALSAHDVSVSEDGSPLPRGGGGTFLSPELVTSRYVLVLVDLSGPLVDSEDFPPLVSAVAAFGRATIARHHVAVAGYDGGPLPATFVDFDQDAAMGLAELARFRPRDRKTDLGNAISWAAMKLAGAMKGAHAPETEGVLVVVADGPDKARRASGDEGVARLREAGIRSFVYAAKSDVAPDEVRRYALAESAFVDTTAEVPPLVEKLGARLADEAASDFVFAYCSAKRRGTHDVAWEITASGTHTTLRSSFSAERMRGGCSPKTRPRFGETTTMATPSSPAAPASPASAAKSPSFSRPASSAQDAPPPASATKSRSFSRPAPSSSDAPAAAGPRFSRPPPPPSDKERASTEALPWKMSR